MDELINEMVMKIPSGYSCASCQKHFTQLVNLKSHIEAKHIESIGVACGICGFVDLDQRFLEKAC